MTTNGGSAPPSTDFMVSRASTRLSSVDTVSSTMSGCGASALDSEASEGISSKQGRQVLVQKFKITVFPRQLEIRRLAIARRILRAHGAQRRAGAAGFSVSCGRDERIHTQRRQADTGKL